MEARAEYVYFCRNSGEAQGNVQCDTLLVPKPGLPDIPADNWRCVLEHLHLITGGPEARELPEVCLLLDKVPSEFRHPDPRHIRNDFKLLAGRRLHHPGIKHFP